MTDPDQKLREVKEFLAKQPLTGADWADLLDTVEWLDENRYNGEFEPEKQERIEDLAFEVGLAAGYALAQQNGGEKDGQ